MPVRRGGRVGGSADEANLKEARELTERCQNAEPDPADLAKLRAWMERDGVMIHAEELTRRVCLAAVASMGNAFVEEAVLAGVRDLVKGVGYEDADPVEQLLILQTATAWLLLHTVQEKQARLEGEGGQSLNVMEALSKRVDRAQNRFTKATETLEKIRALRRMTEYRERPRMLVKAERGALPRHNEDGASQPLETAEFVVVSLQAGNSAGELRADDSAGEVSIRNEGAGLQARPALVDGRGLEPPRGRARGRRPDSRHPELLQQLVNAGDSLVGQASILDSLL